MNLDNQAEELNAAISAANPHVLAMLSRRGEAIFFPKRGILAQTAEASGMAINATIGTALEDNGSPMCLDSLWKQLNVQKKSIFSYAPSFGRQEIRAIWKDTLHKKNPTLAGAAVSLPIVTSALTHGLSMAGYLFVNEGDSLVIPDLYWENYDLIFAQAYGASFATYPTFSGGGFNVDGMAKRLSGLPRGKKLVLLNFPNNPSGYTVTVAEAHGIRDALVAAADAGDNLVVFVDDAYFGLVFEEGVFTESLFSLLAGAHERILCVKFDGPTKEDYVWGFRVGFATFGVKNGTPQLYGALEAKLAGAIRGSISNASNISQSLLLNAYSDPSYEAEKCDKHEVLKRRYLKMREIFASHPEYAAVFSPLPFNSGYFMCVRLVSGNAEAVRRKLLSDYKTGIVAFNDIIRIAFSSTPIGSLEQLIDNIYRAGAAVQNG